MVDKIAWVRLFVFVVFSGLISVSVGIFTIAFGTPIYISFIAAIIVGIMSFLWLGLAYLERMD